VGLHLATNLQIRGEGHETPGFATGGCPVSGSVASVGDWWSLLIVRDAFTGQRRFGESQTSLGVAKNILTVRLRELVADGVLEPVPASDGSAYQEYALTGEGARAAPGHRGTGPVGLRLGGQAGGSEDGAAGAARTAVGGRPPTRPGRRATGSRTRGVTRCHPVRVGPNHRRKLVS